jgi:predicted AlkP superfamily pyrophosphatase or phosphodiesterase
VFVDYVLPNKKPDLTIFWSKEPDATNHAYGPGTCNSIDATRMNGEILGRVVKKLRQLGWEASTDIIITQDHNHSTVSGHVAYFHCGQSLIAALRRLVGTATRSQDLCGPLSC